MPLWVSMDNPDESLEIREGSEVRIRVMGVQMDPSLVVRTTASSALLSFLIFIK